MTVDPTPLSACGLGDLWPEGSDAFKSLSKIWAAMFDLDGSTPEKAEHAERSMAIFACVARSYIRLGRDPTSFDIVFRKIEGADAFDSALLDRLKEPIWDSLARSVISSYSALLKCPDAAPCFALLAQERRALEEAFEIALDLEPASPAASFSSLGAPRL